jgi:hypothetical protein
VESRWAHNSKVGGSKPLSAKFFQKYELSSVCSWLSALPLRTFARCFEVNTLMQLDIYQSKSAIDLQQFIDISATSLDCLCQRQNDSH